MVHLFIVRHGAAADRATFEGAEASRPLTPKGRRRLIKTSRALARTGERIDRLFTSPLVRAVQTAEILARALRLDRIDVLDELAPGADPDALLRVLAAATKKGETIALASHEPLTSRLVARLCATGEFEFPKGAVVRVDVPALGGKGQGVGQVRWTLHPLDKQPRDGLPVQPRER